MSPSLLGHFSQFIAFRMGLHFPPERWEDLANALAAAAGEKGLKDAEAYVGWLLSSKPTRREIETLASHLTVGETYFFRETKSFDVLEGEVLPDLIRSRRSNGRRLRVWSAGCCTGEEPYSIAMLLDRMIPDREDWNLTILATDINPRFLEIAAAGVYGEWSFRAIPPGTRERYFSPLPGGKMQITKRIRRMVTFSFLNLAEDTYPSLVNNTNAMDVVMCRNVLMYFTQKHATGVAGKLHEALVEGGWLLVAPSETSQIVFRNFTMVNFPDVMFYRKTAGPAPRPPDMQMTPTTWPEPLSLHEEPGGQSPLLMAQALANHGDLAEALAQCDQAVSSDALNPAVRFLRAMVAQELGRLDEAMKSLEQALYLDQNFVMAHFVRGSLAMRLGKHSLSERHFRSALSLLEGLAPDVPLPESGGLNAGRLTEIICSAMEGGLGKQ